MTPPNKPNSSPELTEVERLRAALKPFAESIVIDPTKQRGDRHWATFGKPTNIDDVLRAQEALSTKNELPSEIEGLRLQLGEALNAIDRIYGVTLSNNSPAGKLLSIESIVMAALNPKDTER
jgi:hypothetical protein